MKKLTLTRQELYNKVWEKPTSQLAKELTISDVALAKICKKMNIPKPGLGYWAKVKNGRKPVKPALPQGNFIPQHTFYIKEHEEMSEAKEICIESVKNKIRKNSEEIYNNDLIKSLNDCPAPLQNACKRFIKHRDDAVNYLIHIPQYPIEISQSNPEKAFCIAATLLRGFADRKIPIIQKSERRKCKILGEELSFGVRETLTRKKYPANYDKETFGRQYYFTGSGRFEIFITNKDYFSEKAFRFVETDKKKIDSSIIERFYLELYVSAEKIKAKREQRRLRDIANRKEQARQFELQRLRRLDENRIKQFNVWFNNYEQMQKQQAFLIKLKAHIDSNKQDYPDDHEIHKIIKIAEQNLNKLDPFKEGVFKDVKIKEFMW